VCCQDAPPARQLHNAKHATPVIHYRSMERAQMAPEQLVRSLIAKLAQELLAQSAMQAIPS
jgi:hypothetical protein